MGQAIGDLLPAAIAVALSPVPIIAVILILGSRKARSNGPAFAVGWVSGLVIVASIVLLVFNGVGDSDSGSSNAVAIVDLALGVLFLVLALKQWQGRPNPGQQATMPAWMSSIDGIEPGKAVVLGAALSGANPKNLALTMSAAASIAEAGLDGPESALAVAVFVIIGSLTVAGSVLFYIVAGDRARGPLATTQEFMAQHNAVIMMVVLLVLGAKLIGNGIAGLTD